MITPEKVDECRKISAEIGEVEGEITTHMHSIIQLAYSMYGKELDWWDWEYHDDEGELDFRWNQVGPKLVTYMTVTKKGYGELECDYEGAWFDLAECFPTDWLYKTIEEVTILMENGIEKAKARNAAEKKRKAEQAAARKAKKAEIAEQAKSKLTPEERKALGIK
jgi:hypothetical protein